MKKQPKISALLIRCMIPGLLGLALRAVLYRTGFDDRGILSAAHPLHLACCALVCVTGVWLLLKLRSMKKRDLRPGGARTLYRILGGIAAGALLLFSVPEFLKEGGGLLAQIRAVLALAAALSMPVSVYCPREFKLPRLAGRSVICLYFVVDMLCRYRNWSGNPQLPDYVFHVAALVCLSLCSYHRLAFCSGLSKRKTHVFFSLMAMVLCLMSLIGAESRTFYLSGALWAGFGMCTLTPPTRRKKQTAEIQPPQEETP